MKPDRLLSSASQYMLDDKSVASLGTVRLTRYKKPVMNLWLILTNEDYEYVYICKLLFNVKQFLSFSIWRLVYIFLFFEKYWGIFDKAFMNIRF